MSDLRKALDFVEVQAGRLHPGGHLETLCAAARKTLDPITDEEVEAAYRTYESDPALSPRDWVRAALEAFLNGRWPDR